MSGFIHLHVHSDFSVLRANFKIKKIIEMSKLYHMDSVALTDMGNMFGAIEFYKEAKKNNIKPIIGCEILLAHSSFDYKKNFFHSFFSKLILLAKNINGYKNLTKIISSAYFSQNHRDLFAAQSIPLVDLSLINQYKENIYAIVPGFQSQLGFHLFHKKQKEALQVFSDLKNVFQEFLYLGIQNHGLQEEIVLNDLFKTLSQKTNTPLVAINDVHYAKDDEALSNEIVLSILNQHLITQNKTNFLNQYQYNKQTGAITFNQFWPKNTREALPGVGYHFRSSEEMKELFKDYQDAIENTIKIANEIDIILPKGTLHMPSIDIKSNNSDSDLLKKKCLEGLKNKIKPNLSFLAKSWEDYEERLNFELDVIISMNFSSYFLIVADFIRAAKEKGIYVGPGRGSAAGSLVSYSLDITTLDPLEYGLFFERFLNPERTSMPDIDIDFQDDRRDEVIQYCRNKYGHKNVAQIITYGKLKPKAVFKDVARVYNLEFNSVNGLTKLIGASKELKEAYEKNREFQDSIIGNGLKQIYNSALSLEGMTRQTGIHAAGIVIADKPIDEYVPIYVDSDNNIITQYEHLYLEEDCGLIKMDFLGLKTLTIIQKTIETIQKIHGINLDIDQIDFKDKEVFKLFSCGLTVGIFQFESDGMRKYLQDLNPNSIDDLIAMNAMYRPGPLEWIPVYNAKKNNKPIVFQVKEKEEDYLRLERLCEKIKPLHEILEPTKLIPIYQEQIMLIGQEIAGFTLGKSDIMRRAMGKKKSDVLIKLKEEFLKGMTQHYGSDILEEGDFLFEKIIMPFSGYGFNKAHAACYAYLAYQTAYLKVHYPECFYASAINSDINSHERIALFLRDAKELGLPVKGPDINESQLFFEVEKFDLKEQQNYSTTEVKREKYNNSFSLKYGLKGIKGIAESAGNTIIEERKKEKYRSIVDFLSRITTKVNRANIESLIKSGSFDSFNVLSPILQEIYPHLTEEIEKKESIKAGGQLILGGEEEDNQDYLEKLYQDTLKDRNYLPLMQSVKNYQDGKTKIDFYQSNEEKNDSNHSENDLDDLNVRLINLVKKAKEMELETLGINIRHDFLLQYKDVILSRISQPLEKMEEWIHNSHIEAAGQLQNIRVFNKKENNKTTVRIDLKAVNKIIPIVIFDNHYQNIIKNDENLLEELSLVVVKGKVMNQRTNRYNDSKQAFNRETSISVESMSPLKQEMNSKNGKSTWKNISIGINVSYPESTLEELRNLLMNSNDGNTSYCLEVLSQEQKKLVTLDRIFGKKIKADEKLIDHIKKIKSIEYVQCN